MQQIIKAKLRALFPELDKARIDEIFDNYFEAELFTFEQRVKERLWDKTIDEIMMDGDLIDVE